MIKSSDEGEGDDNKSESSEESMLNTISLELLEIRKDIQYAVAPKFLEFSAQTNDLVELGIDFWRMKQRMDKILGTLPENQKKILENSLERIKRYIDKNDIEIVDHTNQKYDEGLNLDVLAVEKDAGVLEAIIKETKEPTILYKGQVVHIGKVIVVSKEILK
jgi:hypothetical protein